MKRFIAIGFLLSCSFGFASAMPPISLSMALASTDTIYLVRVAATDKKQATFDIEETLRGSLAKNITLKLRLLDLKPNEELVIFSSKDSRNGYDGDEVGGVMMGNIGWMFAPVRRENGVTYVANFDPKGGTLKGKDLIYDREMDNCLYFTLDHLKQSIAENPESK